MVFHSDVQGPSPAVFLSGYRWFVTFIDCYSRTIQVYLMHNKSEVFSCFMRFHNKISTQFNAKFQILRSDNGTKYMEGGFQSYTLEHGILHQTTCVNTSNQNGLAKRENKQLLQSARSLMFTRNLPKTYQRDAVLGATYLINKMPLRVLKFRTPMEFLQARGPLLSHQNQLVGFALRGSVVRSIYYLQCEVKGSKVILYFFLIYVCVM